MEALTPASPDSLPLGELIVGEPFWRYPIGPDDREGVAHLRVWLTAGREPGYLAVVTQTGSAASVTESAGQIWAGLARRYGPSLVLLEHHPAPEAGEGGEVRVGADGSRTGWACGRPPGIIPVTPGSNCGWRFTGTRSSASPRAGPARARPRNAELAPARADPARGSGRASVGRGSLRVRSRGTTGSGADGDGRILGEP
jgi:hypothetical protein